ncbi:branched-chain amino acid transport system II carrier protein [Brevibacillus ruminantium]|uniref:Branched-chain amino acid transport system carrier protein n=1 Tax=Brevibacillus ruminantium TaxID=2950604 RepID=A0ABY4WJK6_9BACL|nr:branched-chain amino acid transport system II carrier protein [Brevibacillus ruminantium]USG64841.1 branched-chain amino acid transport system II carrier protein [Brevibacillus ruminantium]
MKELTKRETITIGLMLFALFFGAGNMIFPPALGQTAGTNVWIAMLGFIITGVGLPLLGVVAVGLGGGGLSTLAGRVHPLFGVIFTVIVYLAIGPFLAIPRTGTVSFEMGVMPFLPESLKGSWVPLFISTLIYFALTYWLSLHPSKLVDRIGKILTPVLLLIITMMFIQGFIHPIGEIGAPAGAYEATPFFKGFLEGYLTLDALAAMVFGIVVTAAIKERGIADRKHISMATVKAGIVAAIGLALVYLALGYLGATSQVLGASENGGQILSSVVKQLFGGAGALLLGLAVTLACITTSVGLVTACSRFFSERFPAISYRTMAAILCVFSTAVANVGLTQLISLSVPVLVAIYPLAIVLMLLSFLHTAFKGYSSVYIGAILATAAVSLIDGLVQLGLPLDQITSLYENLPFYKEGIGWLLPAIAGGLLGYLWESLRPRRPQPKQAYREKTSSTPTQ